MALLVLEPETRALYNTTKMAYTIQPYQVSFFNYNQWSESPSQMFHPLIIKALQNTHHFKGIVMPPYFGSYDYALSTQILQLEQDFTVNPPLLRLEVRAQLSHGLSHQIMRTEEFCIEEPLLQKTPYGGVVAANKATAKVLQKLTEFTRSHARQVSP